MSWMTQSAASILQRGHYKLVEDGQHAGGSNTITITGLDLNAAKGYILWLWADTTGATIIRLFYNNDLVVANYYRQYLLATGAAVTGGRSNNPNAMTGTTDGTYNEYHIMQVAGSNPRAAGWTHRYLPNAVEGFYNYHIWDDTANVTRIDLVATAANFTADTYHALFELF